MRLAKVLVVLVLLAASTIGVLAGPPALAASGTQSQVISAPADAAGNRFGFAAALNPDNGTVALVGAPGTNPPTPTNVGKAYVFTHRGSAWPLQQELVPTPSLPQDFFGGAVALSGDGHTALVGAPGNVFASQQVNEPVLPGAAFVFAQNGTNGAWTQQAMLTGSGLPADEFGFAVALSRDGHEAVVGASSEDGGMGAVYVFIEQNGSWTLQARIADPGNSPLPPTVGDNFGFAVAVNPEGHELLVGADQAGNYPGPAGDGAGFADIYVQNDDGTWPATPTQQLTPMDGVLGDGFGDAVALSGDGHVALIGSEEHGPSGQGSAYVFATHGGAWSQQQEVTGSPNDTAFGYVVAIDGNADTAKIGAPFTNDGENAPAYRFTGKVGSWSISLVQTESGPTDYGSAVALNHEGDVELVGADDDLPDSGNGVVYAYEFG